MGGWAARDPVASTKRRALMVVPLASTVSGPVKRALGADHLDAKAFEPLDRVVGRYGGDDAVDVVVDAGEVDLRLMPVDAEAAGVADGIGGSCRRRSWIWTGRSRS